VDYETVNKEARDFGAGLIGLGAKPRDAVGIWSINRPEWVIAFLGFHSQALKTVSLYATLGADAVKYICEHAECEIVIMEKSNLKSFLPIAPQLKNLKARPHTHTLTRSHARTRTLAHSRMRFDVSVTAPLSSLS
jgi:long-chain acyl-CoA synthetase